MHASVISLHIHPRTISSKLHVKPLPGTPNLHAPVRRGLVSSTAIGFNVSMQRVCSSQMIWIVHARHSTAASSSQHFTPTTISDNIFIREGSQADLPFLQKAVLRERMNPLGHKPSNFLVARKGEGGDILGFGQMEVKAEGQSAEQGRQWELRSLVVEHEHRGKGLGSALVEALKAKCSPGDAAYLVTLATTQEFYKRLGFKIVEPPAWIAVEAALGQVMSRQLKP